MTHLKRCLLLVGTVVVVGGLWVGWTWYSITRHEVEFRSGDLVLRGTLLAPRHGNAAPAIVLVHGSGQVSRKSMTTYAWLFALKGYVALAYDKRGVGHSDGEAHEWRQFSFDDLAADAAAAYAFVHSRPRVDQSRVGFFGASQGGWVVSLAATQVSPAFLIMASASLSTVAEDRIYGRQAQVRHAGFSEKAVSEATTLLRADQEVTRTGSGYPALAQLWHASAERDWFDEVYGDQPLEPANSDYRVWERSVLDFNPAPLLDQLQAPTLWIFGDPALDRFSPVALSLNRVSKAKSEGACYQAIQIDGVGHTLEPESGGLFSILRVRLPLVLDIYRWLDGFSC